MKMNKIIFAMIFVGCNFSAVYSNEMLTGLLGAGTDGVSVGAAGIGGSMLMSGMAEQNQDELAKIAASANLSSITCSIGNRANIPLDSNSVFADGGNELMELYAEYTTISTRTKNSKTALNMAPGIESEVVMDKSTMGLYDDEGGTALNSTFASMSDAVRNPNDDNATQINQQSEDARKKVTTGAIVGAGGLAFGVGGDILTNVLENKQSK